MHNQTATKTKLRRGWRSSLRDPTFNYKNLSNLWLNSDLFLVHFKNQGLDVVPQRQLKLLRLFNLAK